MLSFEHLKGVKAPNPKRKRVSGAYASTGTNLISDFFFRILSLAVSLPDAKQITENKKGIAVSIVFFNAGNE